MGQHNDLEKKRNNNSNKKESEEGIDEKGTPEEKTLAQQQQQQQQQANDVPNKKRKRKEVFPFGNYRSYYGYRIGHDLDEDPRLKIMKKEWFEGKDCLDIGCNSGIITIHIAKKFHCRSILGIDIDSSRIEDARWHLRKLVRLQASEKADEKKCSSEGADRLRSSEGADRLRSSEVPSTSLSNVENKVENRRRIDLSQIVSFRKENVVQSWNLDENRYDTILCLSVTKWIHLNWGDDGLITLFSKIWKLLHQGGILVLEPQPWKSYDKNRRVSETTAANYHKIVLHPEYFQEILLDKIGFRTVEDLTSRLSGVKTGFDRPILAFRK